GGDGPAQAHGSVECAGGVAVVMAGVAAILLRPARHLADEVGQGAVLGGRRDRGSGLGGEARRGDKEEGEHRLAIRRGPGTSFSGGCSVTYGPGAVKRSSKTPTSPRKEWAKAHQRGRISSRRCRVVTSTAGRNGHACRAEFPDGGLSRGGPGNCAGRRAHGPE